MAVKKKKEFKQLDPEEIVSRVNNFLDTQRLEEQSKYFIHKLMMERSWEAIRPDENGLLSDFYTEDDFSEDVDLDIPDEEDIDLVEDDDEEEIDGEDPELNVIPLDDDEEVLVNDSSSDEDSLSVDDLMDDVSEENKEDQPPKTGNLLNKSPKKAAKKVSKKVSTKKGGS